MVKKMDANTKIIVIAVVALLVGVGVGYGVSAIMSDTSDNDEEYYFYLYFEADDERNGWYSATASDAAVAFDKAMNKANFEIEISNGYVIKIDDLEAFWSVYEYLYKQTDSEAAESSILGYGGILNGWGSFSGYGDYDAYAISQSNSNIFFSSVYAGMTAPTPADVDDWMNSGPFKA